MLTETHAGMAPSVIVRRRRADAEIAGAANQNRPLAIRELAIQEPACESSRKTPIRRNLS